MNAFSLYALCAGVFPVSLLLVLAGCSQPLADSAALGAEQTQRALVGYEKTHYVYPVQVPDSNRYVDIVVPEPLGYEPTYADYVKWKAGESMARKAEPIDATHEQ